MILEPLVRRLKQEKSITFTVRIRSNASITSCRGVLADGTLKIDLAAVAEQGKANEELVQFLGMTFDVPRSSVQIIRGHHSRQKVVRVACS